MDPMQNQQQGGMMMGGQQPVAGAQKEDYGDKGE
jgi:hypothetical protein